MNRRSFVRVFTVLAAASFALAAISLACGVMPYAALAAAGGLVATTSAIFV